MRTYKYAKAGAYHSDGFIGRYQQLVRNTVVPYQYSVLSDSLPDTEKSHVIANFVNAGKALRGEDIGDGFYGMVFQDSDAAKWIEAAAYTLANGRDEALEETVDRLIEMIAQAQDADGYLNTRFTITDREKRWKNLLEGHELYCSGHMMEAACAYYEATGKRRLLDVMEKNAEHIYRRFVAEKTEGYPGHPEIELALMKMYHATGNPHCLELAEHFINSRGQDPSYYEKEKAGRDWQVWGSDPADHDYQQCSKPVREQTEAVGHAVRAVYLYTGMAELAAETGDEELFAACRRLWDNIVRRKMYITGGIGATVIGEAFSSEYDLPGDTAYAETCASIGLIFFARGMLANRLDREYADIMELALYNTVLAGMQLDGKRFFYVNPREVIPGISGVSPNRRHDLTQRPGWYACACCPPNAARLISSVGQYAYGESGDTAYCHLYCAGETEFENGMKLVCRTGYPYDFDIEYEVSGSGRLAVRIPSWSAEYSLTVNGEKVEAELTGGYAVVAVADGDRVKLVLDGSPRFAYASGKVPALSGKTAVCRGPLVYCFEGADNDGDVITLTLDTQSKPTACGYDPKLLCGTERIAVSAYRTAVTDELYTSVPPEKVSCTAYAVPYYTWANRGENQMRVWMDV